MTPGLAGAAEQHEKVVKFKVRLESSRDPDRFGPMVYGCPAPPDSRAARFSSS